MCKQTINQSQQSMTKSQTESRKTARSVKFSTIEIRKYNRILGDNPACTSGPPTQLDWGYTSLPSKTLDEYEDNRLPRRTRRHLALTSITRRNSMYYHFGYTHEEIDKAAEGIKKFRKQRDITKSLRTNGHKEKTQEAVQNVTRRIKRTFSKEKIYIKSEWDQFRTGSAGPGSLISTTCIMRAQDPVTLLSVR